MKKPIEEIKEGDIFIYNGHEEVAIDDYLAGSAPYLWVTVKEYYIDPNNNPEGYVYGYTSACVEIIPSHTEVEYIGNMKEVNHE